MTIQGIAPMGGNGLPQTVRQVMGPIGLHALDMGLAGGALSLPVLAGGSAAAPAAPGGQAERGYSVVRGVAAIGLRGVLTPNSDMLARWYGWSTYHGLAALAADLESAEDVSAIAIEADSPGGLVLGLEAAAEAVAALAKVKPVHVLVHPMAASAAYWIASQASEIVLTPGAVVGSIGVGLETYSFVQPSQIYGEQWFSVTSTNARAKWPEPATADGMAEIKRSLDEVEARFHAAVSAGRKIGADQLTARLSVSADPRDGGAVFAGADAITRGLADRIETRTAFYDRLFGTYAPPAAKGASGQKAAVAAAAARARAAKAIAGG